MLVVVTESLRRPRGLDSPKGRSALGALLFPTRRTLPESLSGGKDERAEPVGLLGERPASPLPGDPDGGVDRHGEATVLEEERVDIDRFDVAVLQADTPEGDQDPGQGSTVCGFCAADRTQDCRSSDAVHHRHRVAFLERGDPEADIIQDLGVDAAQTEHHARAELWIPDHAGHEFARCPDLLLHQDAVQPSGRSSLDGPERRRETGQQGE